MSEAKFTKGPWVFDDYRNLNAGGGQLKVEGICIPCGHSKDEVRANMDLISMAPDMYDYIDGLHQSLALNGGVLDLDEDDFHYLGKVIAKARGES